MLSALCFLSACSSTLPPVPVAQIKQESNEILDRIIEKCEKKSWNSNLLNESTSCNVRKERKVYLCEDSLGRTPFDGKGYRVFEQEIEKRYPITFQVRYRGVREHNNGELQFKYNSVFGLSN